MEIYFATLFEDVRHERSLIILLSLTDPDVLKSECNKKKLASKKLHRQWILKEYVAVYFLE